MEKKYVYTSVYLNKRQIEKIREAARLLSEEIGIEISRSQAVEILSQRYILFKTGGVNDK